MIETVDLHRGYRIGNKSIEVLHGVDLRIRRGERVFLCGPSGAGKTTLLYTLAGLERPERGLVRIDGVVPIICGDDQGDDDASVLVRTEQREILWGAHLHCDRSQRVYDRGTQRHQGQRWG